MPKFTEDEIADKKDAFLLFDRKGDEKIDSNQIGDVLRAIGLNPTEAELKKILHDVDPTGVKRVSFEEFLPIVGTLSNRREQGTQEDFIEGLRVFDKDGNGMISAGELRHVLTSLGERLSDDEVDQLLQGVEHDSGGNINYEEFVKLIMSQ
ncbi:myosin light chain 3, skeletal muscle isoform-like [Oscarella lobularis]|uniref:myosin light chain 3, skeletal muscle isoform-like n=1 Tax=Oscarella lobularis TaxID=121494 RepID=UPI00331366A7